jgi:hypothetical protein
MIALLLPLLALQSAPDAPTAVDAERAMEEAAQTEGQWTAIRRFAAPDAVVLARPPHGIDGLPKEDPRTAYHWQVAQSFVSCDGNTAVNTGPWQRSDRSGYFTTAWERQKGGQFKWVVDSGDALETPRIAPPEPLVKKASCEGKPQEFPLVTATGGPSGDHYSADKTLRWSWQVMDSGTILFTLFLWDGKEHRNVLRDTIRLAR